MSRLEEQLQDCKKQLKEVQDKLRTLELILKRQETPRIVMPAVPQQDRPLEGVYRPVEAEGVSMFIASPEERARQQERLRQQVPAKYYYY